MNKFLVLPALGGVLWIGGCASNAPSETATNNKANNETVIIKSPAKPAGHSDDAAHGSEVHTHSTRFSVTSTPVTVPGSESATMMTLQIVDKADGKPINDYEIVHDKKLHLILASSDLNWFNHLHPEFIGNGKFRVTTTFPKAGKFRVYADYKPKGEEGEVGYAELNFKAGDSDSFALTPKLVADKMQDGWMKVQSPALPEGQAEAGRAQAELSEYQVALMPMPGKIKASEDVMLHFQVRDSSGKPVKDLQPYLGAKGHCVILSADPKVYLHTHPTDGEHQMEGMSTPAAGGGDVMFHTNFPRAGLYKVWGQFKHKNKIITAPFVVNVAEGSASTPVAQAIPANAQKISIDLPGGYKPGAATIKAGTPVAITFNLKSDAGCGNIIALPAAKWSKNLKVGQSATVVYTPTKTGELKFACDMDMYRGTIKVE